jgi:hypothetical protein
MAAQITHMLAGEEALKEALGLSREGAADAATGAAVAALEAVVGDALPAFRFGCQGPDIFYHNQRTKPSGLHYGSLAHRRRSGSLVAAFAAALPEEERGPESPRGAYLLGLSTHAAVDRATHPFIICFSGWADPAKPATQRRRGCHPFLERLLDSLLLEKRLGLSPDRYGVSTRMAWGDASATGATGASARDSREPDAALVELWAAGLREAFPRAAGSDALLEERIANALADARHFYAATDPAATRSREGQTGGKLRISKLPAEEARYVISVLYPLLRPEGMDPMNESGIEWLDPSGDGRSSRASYPKLVDEGASAAAKAIGLVLDFWRGGLSASSLAEGLGEGGLALRDPSGAAIAPRVCRPLALPEAMDAEYAARVREELGDLGASAR